MLPLLLPVVAWLTGLFLFYGDILDVTAAWSWTSTIWLLLAIFLLCIRRDQRWRIIVLCFCFGCFWAMLCLYYSGLHLQVRDDWLQAKHGVKATVSAVANHPHYTRLTLKNIQRDDDVVLPTKAFAYVRNQRHGTKAAEIQTGDILHLFASWRLPSNHHNPDNFDYLSYCFDRNIALLASVRQWELLDKKPSIMQATRSGLHQQLMQADKTGILAALLLADKTQLDVAVSDAFAAAGIAHLLAISGLHIGMVALWAGALCWWCLTRRETWIVHYNVRRWSLFAGMFAALIYASLAAWPLPTQRAVLMLAATVLAWWLRARSSPVNTLLAALWLITLWDAAAVASISLWLSFSASLGLLIYANAKVNTKDNDTGANNNTIYHMFINGLYSLLAVSAIASLATLPWIAHVFHQLPLYSLFANLIFVPLYTLLILPIALIATLVSIFFSSGVADFLFNIVSYFIAISNQLLLFWHTNAPASHLWLGQPPLLAGIALFCVLLLLAYYTYYLQQHKRWSALVLAFALVMYGIGIIKEKKPEVTTIIAWDVGQGAAASVLFPDGFVLSIDAPGDDKARYNGGTTVASGLQAFGLVHADVLLLSHAQSDHMGGLGRLVDNLRFVSELWLADVPDNYKHAGVQRLISKVEQRGGHIRWLYAGMSLPLGHISNHATMKVLWPPKDFAPKDGNQNSLVLSISFGDLENKKAWLFSGDAGRATEYALLRDLQNHDGVLMPHHGSNTASSAAWLRAVKPQYAIAQTGKNNSFGFPRPIVVERYKMIGTKWWNTANGAIIVDENISQPYQSSGFSNRHAANYTIIYLASMDVGN
ncbi:MAG: DNA internalization-related competence protein ComEC/Rec2 [Mariprofundales bacterium]